MGEVVSEDMLGWARDLAAIQKLLAGEPLDQPVRARRGVVTPKFGATQARGSDPRLPRAPRSPRDSQQVSA